MRRAWGHCAAVLSRVIFIGFGVQIALGVIWMCCAFAKLQGVGEGFLCAGQILLAVFAAYCFLRCVGMSGRGLAVFASLAVVTFPMVLQCHMTASPQSAVSSALLLAIGGILKIWRKRKIYLLIQLPLAIILGGAIACVFVWFQGGHSIKICETSRIAWSTLKECSEAWGNKTKKALNPQISLESSYDACGIQEIMAPYLNEKFEKKKAEAWMKKIIKFAWKRHAPEIRKEIVWDAAGYVAAPVILQLQLQGRAYDSYSGGNYSQVLRVNPHLGKAYMYYGCWWFQAGLAIAVILIFFQIRGFGLRDWIVALLPGIVMALIYTMSAAGQMDYKKTTYLLCVWLAVIVTAAVKTESR